MKYKLSAFGARAAKCVFAPTCSKRGATALVKLAVAPLSEKIYFVPDTRDESFLKGFSGSSF
jgi:hypothetical protein